MWKCPKCGRSFKNVDQHHFCSEAPKTIDEYILAQDENRREQLEQVRKAIAGSIPGATEKISWSMPTFWDGHNIIHFAAAKKHIGLYPGAEAVEFFAPLLTAYKTSKGAIQLPNNRDLPLDLIAEIARWCWETNRK